MAVVELALSVSSVWRKKDARSGREKILLGQGEA
jgi:hypothetical protein